MLGYSFNDEEKISFLIKNGFILHEISIYRKSSGFVGFKNIALLKGDDSLDVTVAHNDEDGHLYKYDFNTVFERELKYKLLNL